MQCRTLQSVAAVVLIVALSGCKCLCHRGEEKEPPAKVVALADVPAPAKGVIEELMAGGEIAKIEKEGEGKKAVYDVEGKVGGKNVEYDIAADGRMLSSEESVPFASLPTGVRNAAARYFGTSEGLSASKEEGKGNTFYEITGKKDGKTATVKMTRTGRIREEEKE